MLTKFSQTSQNNNISKNNNKNVPNKKSEKPKILNNFAINHTKNENDSNHIKINSKSQQQIKTPKKIENQNNPIKKSNRQEISSEPINYQSNNSTSGHRGIQRGFLLYSKAIEKKKFRFVIYFSLNNYIISEMNFLKKILNRKKLMSWINAHFLLV